jgi:alcohol dehydrogenase
VALYEIRKFVAPEFIFGVGARKRVSYYARNMMARRVLIVSDPGVEKSGWLGELRQCLDDAGIASVVFSNLSDNPKDVEVMEGARFYADERCDLVVAIGGGSVIDCAKAIGIAHTNGMDICAFEGIDKVEVPGPPLICIPTTSGSSADISQFCIIVNSRAHYKMAIISKTVVPDVALVDPETTLTLGPYLTACTGIDALTHAIEAYVSTASARGDPADLEQSADGRVVPERSVRPGKHVACELAGRAGVFQRQPGRGSRACSSPRRLSGHATWRVQCLAT